MLPAENVLSRLLAAVQSQFILGGLAFMLEGYIAVSVCRETHRHTHPLQIPLLLSSFYLISFHTVFCFTPTSMFSFSGCSAEMM